MPPDGAGGESISFRYGRGTVRLEIPARNLSAILRAGHLPSPGAPALSSRGAGSGGALLEAAVRRAGPAFAGPLQGKRVSLLVSDATREEPRALWARAVSPALRGARSVLVVLSTGSHSPDASSQKATAREVERLLAGHGVVTGEALIHDSLAGELHDAGTTRAGTRVRLARLPMEAEAFVVVSDMKPHYFAGYSSPPKFIFPGLAARSSIEANHSFTLDPASATGRHPWHPDPSRRSNPLAADCCEAFELALAGRPAVALAFGSSDGQVLWAEAGPARETTSRGILRVDATSGARAEPSRHLVVSPGGYPNDMDLYVGQRALELCHQVMAPGARVLFLCACEEGLGPDHAVPVFIDPLRGDLRRAAAGPDGPYRLYSHKAIRFARMITALKSFHLSSEMDAAVMAGLPFLHAPDPREILRGWLAEEPQARILAIDGASKLSVTAA